MSSASIVASHKVSLNSQLHSSTCARSLQYEQCDGNYMIVDGTFDNRN